VVVLEAHNAALLPATAALQPQKAALLPLRAVLLAKDATLLAECDVFESGKVSLLANEAVSPTIRA
jgi:hypothetical protein